MPFQYKTPSAFKTDRNNCYMEVQSINVDVFYARPEYYGFIPTSVFDALEAAFVEGKASAVVLRSDYNKMMSNFKAARLCPEF